MTDSRLAFRLAFAILCGVALVLLPLAFSVGTTSPNVGATNSSSSTTFGPQRLLAPIPSASPSLVFAGTLLSVIFFVFLPAIAVSVIVRSWAEKRARD